MDEDQPEPTDQELATYEASLEPVASPCRVPGCNCPTFNYDAGEHPGICNCRHDDGQHR
jgi:hypothetical protein